MHTLNPEEILSYHVGGKIGMEIVKKLSTQKDLSLAYTPGVAHVCKAIAKGPTLTREYTCKKNLVAVMTDGSSVLGLGNIGPEAFCPVMEGKAALFKKFADVNAWPVPIDCNLNGELDTELFIEIAKRISCNYGGINLEDIAAPRCFEIESRLDNLTSLSFIMMHVEQPVLCSQQYSTTPIYPTKKFPILKL